MLRFRFKACIKCRGDLALDDGDWICLQCGTYYYVGLYRGAQPVGPAGMPGPAGMESREEDLRNKDFAGVSGLGGESWMTLGLWAGALRPELIRQ